MNIIFLKGEIDIDLIKNYADFEIYVLDYQSHKILRNNSITHNIADDILTDDDSDKIFDKIASLYNWSASIPNDLEFEVKGVNILNVIDSMEIHSFLSNFLYEFTIIKRILEKKCPKKVIITNSLKKIIVPFFDNYEFEYKILENIESNLMVYDNLELKFNLGRIPMSIRLSRKNYQKIKKIIEKIVSTVYKLNMKESTGKKIVLFLEMNPIDYEFLIKELSDRNTQIVFFNNRRSAVWNTKAVKILSRNNCKIIDLENISKNNNSEKTALGLKNKINALKTNNNLKEKFVFENISFWNGINDDLLNTIEKRLSWYIILINNSEKILKDFNIKQILSVNVVGETEKTILTINQNKIPSIMLEHAFANYTAEIARYDILSMYPLFKDRIAVWGNVQKEYITKQHKIDDKRIIVSGSPRHDIFFKEKKSIQLNQKKIILITLRPIIETALHKKIETHIKYENLILRILKYLQKQEFQIIVKLHPGLDLHNSQIKKIIKKNYPKIRIYQSNPIREFIEKAHSHINISPEGFDLSTVVLESIIYNIPVMNIILDKKIYDFEINRTHSILNIFEDKELEMKLENFIFDNNLRKSLIKNGESFLQKYMSNMGTASMNLAQEIKKSIN